MTQAILSYELFHIDYSFDYICIIINNNNNNECIIYTIKKVRVG